MTDRSIKSIIVPWLVCMLGAIVYSYEYLLRMSPSVMQHSLMKYYHLTGMQYGYLSGSFYYIMYVAMQIVVGLLVDRYGPRRLLTVACLVCALGAWLFAASSFLSVAMIGRFLIGFGSAFAFVGATKLATIWLPPERFAIVSGVIFCLGMLGAVFGDTVLRAFIDTVGWQNATHEVAFAGIILALFIWFFIRDSSPYQKKTQIYKNQEAHMKDVFNGLRIAVRMPQIWICGFIGCLLYLFLSTFAEFAAPAWLHQVHGLSRNHSAYATSLIFLGCAIGAPVWGVVSDTLRLRRLPMIVGAVGSLVTFCMLLYLHNLSNNEIYILLFLFGFLSSVQILVFAIGRELMMLRSSGTVIGLINMLVMISGLVFPPIVGKLLDLGWDGTTEAGMRVYSTHDYTVAFSALPVGIFIGILLLLCLKETFCHVHAVENLDK